MNIIKNLQKRIKRIDDNKKDKKYYYLSHSENDLLQEFLSYAEHVNKCIDECEVFLTYEDDDAQLIAYKIKVQSELKEKISEFKQ